MADPKQPLSLIQMKPNEELLATIDQYLNGQLEDAARKAFEARCAAEPELADLMREHVQAEYAVRTTARESRRTALNNAFEEWDSDTPVRRFPFRPWGVAAAIFAILVGLAVAFGIFAPAPTPEALFAEAFEAEPFSGRRTSSQWQQAGDAYTLQDYPEAIRLLSELLADSNFNNRPRAYYYLAHSHLLAGQPQEALVAFQAVSPESSFIRQSEWYIALVYLKIGNREQALNSLRQITSQTRHYRLKEATNLLEALD